MRNIYKAKEGLDMEKKIYKIRLGQWRERVISEDRIIYQCSECGNIDNPEKEVCSCCRAEMMKAEG